jgi:hypothetical protein
VLVLDDFDAIDNLHEAGLENFGLSKVMVSQVRCVEKARASRLKPSAAMTSLSMKRNVAVHSTMKPTFKSRLTLLVLVVHLGPSSRSLHCSVAGSWSWRRRHRTLPL